jgi:hypothetical protein
MRSVVAAGGTAVLRGGWGVQRRRQGGTGGPSTGSVSKFVARRG